MGLVYKFHIKENERLLALCKSQRTCTIKRCILNIFVTNEDDINYNTPNFNSPEEAIISAIEYLVENNLIK